MLCHARHHHLAFGSRFSAQASNANDSSQPTRALARHQRTAAHARWRANTATDTAATEPATHNAINGLFKHDDALGAAIIAIAIAKRTYCHGTVFTIAIGTATCAQNASGEPTAARDALCGCRVPRQRRRQ